MSDWDKRWIYSDNLRKQIARNYSVHFMEEVLPLINSLPERDRPSAIAFETERMLKVYEEYLSKACDHYQKIAEDTLNTAIKPLIFTRNIDG